MKEKRQNILDEALKLVPFDGWSDKTLKNAAVNIGLEAEYAEISFPKGAPEAIEMFLEQTDIKMLEKIDGESFSKLKIREKIEFAVQAHLETLSPYKTVVRKIVSFYASPFNLGATIPSAIPSLWKTVDKIWYAAGDKSADFNYYTKRTTLAGVYSSTLLYWLKDKSKDHEQTRGFLRRRIENIMQFNKIKAKTNSLLCKIKCFN